MAYDKSQATAEFTRWSESYDRSVLQWLLFEPSHRAMIERIRANFGAQPFRVLDVGCGTGVFAARIRESFPNSTVCGVDLVLGMLSKGAARWRRHADCVMPVQADSERLPFASGTFDVVTCANSFHHYPHQQQAVSEMMRVLRPNGRLLLVDGFRDALWGWFIFDVCVAGVEGHVHHCSRGRMKDLFQVAGFEKVEQTVHRGAAPFLLSEGVVGPAQRPMPHFATSRPITTSAAVVGSGRHTGQ